METSAWLGLLGFFSGLLGTGLTIGIFWFTIIGGLRKSIGRNDRRISVLEERTKDCDACQKDYANLSLKMDIFWEAMKPALLKAIHSPNHPRRDYFSEVFLQNQRPLTREELLEYRKLLTKAIQEDHEPGKVMAFSMVLAKVDEKLITNPEQLRRRKDDSTQPANTAH